MPGDLYGASSPRELYDETYENYKAFLNPPLARVMKVSGSPVEVRAAGTTIWDHEGKAYLDFAGGYGVFTLGHSHPRVVAAVKTQLDSGTEAVEGALKLARAATGRAKIVATHGAFHGKTIGSLSVTGRDYFRGAYAPLLDGVAFVPYGDAAALDGALDDAAAFIVEPVQGEGGINLPPPGYLTAARALCDAAGALLIVDEVQTGLGRCGKLFACEFDGVVPDVMTLAKGLSGGVVPIGAYIARPAAWNAAYAKAPLMHTSTFGGSPLACAAALAALDVLRDDDLARNAAKRGAQLLAGARRVAAEYPAVVADVRGVGLLVGVELRSEGYGGTIIPEMLKRGVTAAWTLNLQRVIRLEPPLIVTEAEVDCAIGALEEAVRAAYERLGALGEATD